MKNVICLVAICLFAFVSSVSVAGGKAGASSEKKTAVPTKKSDAKTDGASSEKSSNKTATATKKNGSSGNRWGSQEVQILKALLAVQDGKIQNLQIQNKQLGEYITNVTNELNRATADISKLEKNLKTLAEQKKEEKEGVTDITSENISDYLFSFKVWLAIFFILLIGGLGFVFKLIITNGKNDEKRRLLVTQVADKLQKLIHKLEFKGMLSSYDKDDLEGKQT